MGDLAMTHLLMCRLGEVLEVVAAPNEQTLIALFCSLLWAVADVLPCGSLRRNRIGPAVEW
jgi:hypothetical protein